MSSLNFDTISLIVIMLLLHFSFFCVMLLYSRIIQNNGFIEVSLYHLSVATQFLVFFISIYKNSPSLMSIFSFLNLLGHLFLILGFTILLKKNTLISYKTIPYYCLIYALLYAFTYYLTDIYINDRTICFTVITISFIIISIMLIIQSKESKPWPYLTAAALFLFDALQFISLILSSLALNLDFKLVSYTTEAILVKGIVVSIFIPCCFTLITLHQSSIFKYQNNHLENTIDTGMYKLKDLFTKDASIPKATTLFLIHLKFHKSTKDKDRYRDIMSILRYIKTNVRVHDITALYNEDRIIGIMYNTQPNDVKKRLYNFINQWQSVNNFYSHEQPVLCIGLTAAKNKVNLTDLVNQAQNNLDEKLSTL